ERQIERCQGAGELKNEYADEEPAVFAEVAEEKFSEHGGVLDREGPNRPQHRLSRTADIRNTCLRLSAQGERFAGHRLVIPTAPARERTHERPLQHRS